MQTFANLDLLTLGIIVAATCILGFTVYFSNRKSVTNRIFLLLTLDISIWCVLNYFTYQFSDPSIELWFVRGVLFFAVFQSFLIYELFVVFPLEKYTFSKWHIWFALPLNIFVAILTLTPFIFSGFTGNILIGQVTGVVKAPAWPLFAIDAALFTVLAFFVLIKKIALTEKLTRTPLYIMLGGLIGTYFFILTFNLFLPILYNNTIFIPLSSLFVFPFIVCAAYAILKQKLIHEKSAEAGLLTFVLLTVTFLGIMYSYSTTEILLRSGAFLIAIVVGIFLMRTATNLSLANMRLKELDELKKEFTALATHHISTPLTAIKGYTSLLREGDFVKDSKEEHEVFESLDRLTENMVSLTRDFLDVSHLDDNKLVLTLKNTDLKEIIAAAIDHTRTKAENKGITIEFLPEKTVYTITADRERLIHAFSTILENSIKYLHGGKIKITIGSQDSLYSITFSDTASRNVPVISDRLLKKFSEAESKSDNSVLSYGLGIYAAKRICEAHKGNLVVITGESGTTFKISLPS